MAFDAGELIAKFKVDTRSGISSMNKVEKATKKSQNSFNQLKVAASAFVAALAVGAVTRFGRALFDAAESGAKFSAAFGAFKNLGGNESLIDQVKGVTSALSRRDIVETANTLEILGIGMKNTARFAEIARSAAIGLGGDVSTMLEQLSKGTARQSKLRLDDLGIIISLDEANKKYAASVGKLTGELTDNEKRIGFLNEVMVRGQDIIDKVGTKSETNAEKIASLSSAWTDLNDQMKIFIGNVAAEPFAKLAKDLENLNTTLRSPGFMDKLRGVYAFMIGPEALAAEAKAQKGKGPLGFVGPNGAAPPGPNISGPKPGITQEDVLTRAFTNGLRQAQVAFIKGESAGSAFGPTMPGGFTPGIQSAQAGEMVPAPDLVGTMAPLVTEVNLADDAMQALGTSVSFVFEQMTNGSMSAGRAFATAMTAGIASVAGSMGKLFIGTGMGTLALQSLNPFAMIAAGLALQAISGIFSGISSKQSFTPSFSRGQTRGANREDFRSGNLTVIVQGDMVGEDLWMDRLVNRLNRFQRNTGASLQVQT